MTSILAGICSGASRAGTARKCGRRRWIDQYFDQYFDQYVEKYVDRYFDRYFDRYMSWGGNLHAPVVGVGVGGADGAARAVEAQHLPDSHD